MTIKINYFCCIGISICVSLLCLLFPLRLCVCVCVRLSDYVTYSSTHQISYAFRALPFDIFPVFHSAKHARPSKILTAFTLKTAAVSISFALKVQNQQSDCLYKSMYTGICKCRFVCVRVWVLCIFGFGQVHGKSPSKTSYHLWLIFRARLVLMVLWVFLCKINNGPENVILRR